MRAIASVKRRSTLPKDADKRCDLQKPPEHDKGDSKSASHFVDSHALLTFGIGTCDDILPVIPSGRKRQRVPKEQYDAD